MFDHVSWGRIIFKKFTTFKCSLDLEHLEIFLSFQWNLKVLIRQISLCENLVAFKKADWFLMGSCLLQTSQRCRSHLFFKVWQWRSSLEICHFKRTFSPVALWKFLLAMARSLSRNSLTSSRWTTLPSSSWFCIFWAVMISSWAAMRWWVAKQAPILWLWIRNWYSTYIPTAAGDEMTRPVYSPTCGGTDIIEQG